jgi:twinkle protein
VGQGAGSAHHTGQGLLTPGGPGDAYPALDKRRLKPTTLKRFGYFLAPYKGQTVHVAPYYNQQGELCAQKVRFPDKSFAALGHGLGEARLFGTQVFGDKYDKRLIITEGELDAMSVAQEMEFGCAVVSINVGSKGAAKCLKANWLWVNRFEDVVLWFDDDEPGRVAAEECATLFAVGKVRLAKDPKGAKDASDVLQQGRPGDIKTIVFAATAWRPPGIVNAADSPNDVCEPKEDDTHAWSYAWPWPNCTDTLGPMLPGQVIYHVAGTGIGKSTALAEIAHFVAHQDGRVAMMCFEDTRRDIKLRLLTITSNINLAVKKLPDAEMRRLHEATFGLRHFELFDPETAEWSVEAILGYVRYCAKALDCRVVFIDPLTFIAAGLSLSDDERRCLDKASRDLAALAKELGIVLHIAHHLTDPRGTGDGGGHTEGAASHLNQVRGSGGIANFASIVIGHERNQQATEGGQFLLTRLRALKNRPRSITGPMQVLKYNLETGRLLLTKEPFPEPKRKGQRAVTMPPVGDDY